MPDTTIEKNAEHAEKNLWVVLSFKVLLPGIYIFLSANIFAALAEIFALAQPAQVVEAIVQKKVPLVSGRVESFRLLPLYLGYLAVAYNIKSYVENYYMKLRVERGSESLYYASLWILFMILAAVVVAMNSHPGWAVAGFVLINGIIWLFVLCARRAFATSEFIQTWLDGLIAPAAWQRFQETAIYGLLYLLWWWLGRGVPLIGVEAADWSTPSGQRIHTLVQIFLGWAIAASVCLRALVKVKKSWDRTHSAQDVEDFDGQAEAYYQAAKALAADGPEPRSG